MIFFDLDGTLYRTHETCLPPLYSLCRSYGLNLTKEDESFLLYTTADALLNRIAPDMPKEHREKFKYDLKWMEIEAVKERGRLFDGVADMLSALYEKGTPLAICGMGSKEYIDCVLDRCRIRHYFDAILHRIEGKTKSQVLSEFLANEKLAPEDCLMIGDSATDFTAAKDNKISFIGVSYGFGAEEIQNDATMIDNPSQILGEIFRTQIYAQIENDIRRLSKPIVIGVNGVDTSGKTYFATGLNRYLGAKGFDAQLIHLDDFHNPRTIRGKDASPQGYIEYAFNLPQFQSLITEIKSQPTDKDITVLDLDTDTYAKKMHVKTTADSVIIVEGVLLYRPPIKDLFDYKVFLDIDFDEVLRRANERDVPKYGADFIDRYIQRYIPAQKIYLNVFRPKETCDLLIDNNNYNKPLIATISPE